MMRGCELALATFLVGYIPSRVSRTSHQNTEVLTEKSSHSCNTSPVSILLDVVAFFMGMTKI